MRIRPLHAIAFVLAYAALCQLNTVTVTAYWPGHSIFYPDSTVIVPSDNTPPKPVDVPRQAIAAMPTPVDQNRRGRAGASVVVVTLMWLGALAWVNALA